MNSEAGLARALHQAARVVSRVAAGRSLADELGRAAEEGAAVRRGALIDLTHGTLRRYGRAQATVAALSRRGRPDALVEALLWCALYALDSQRYAAYTVVDQAVQACVLLRRWNARGYVNAVLRSYLRGGAPRSAMNEEACYQHPQWWIDIVRHAYPECWQTVLAVGNEPGPMTLRVNARRTSPERYLAQLQAAAMRAQHLGGEALLLEQPVPVDRLPGFYAGEVSVQDAGAQRAAHCLDLAPGQRVLDACAAPGGKAAHILERADVALTALDVDPARCARVAANLARLGLQADIRPADCTRTQDWWDGRPFDRILADVPCSASGVARRHPDIKWLRRAADVEAFGQRQGAILDALWRLLAANGKLLYVTCSVFPQENEAVVASFMARSRSRRLPLPDGGPDQWLPAREHDGFYHALIQKEA